MRVTVIGVAVLLVLLYVGGAFYFYEQEKAAQEPGSVALDPAHLQHPEATLALIHEAAQANNFSDEVLGWVKRSLAQVPSFYEPPFFLASFHANRIEDPRATRRGYEAALRRYPANGRLHLAYAQWLLSARSRFLDIGGMTGADALSLAEDHVQTALAYEPGLTGTALGLLERFRVPAERWTALVPEDLSSRRVLVSALARAGHRVEALALLRKLLQEHSETKLLRDASQWAQVWGDPDVALDLARAWQEAARREGLDQYRQATLQVVRALLQQGDPQAAYEASRGALEEIQARSSATSRVALELLCGTANAYLESGHTLMAESLFTEAKTLSPGWVPASLGLARSYRESGNPEAAIGLYREVLRLDPDNAEAERELAPLILAEELTGRKD